MPPISEKIRLILSLTGVEHVNRSLKGLASRLNAVGAQARNAGLAFTALATGVAFGIASIMRPFREFDDLMRQVEARIVGITPDGIARLRKEAKLLGRTTSFTAIQVADLMRVLGQGGLSAQEVEKVTSGVLNLAKATSADTATAAGVFMEAMRTMGMSASDTTKIVDQLAFATAGSNMTLEDMRESIKFATQISGELGLNLEDAAAGLMVLANAGIRGTQAGTALRRVQTELATQTEKLKEEFQGLDVTRDIEGNFKNLAEIFQEVNNSTKDLTKPERLAKFRELFGLLGITGAVGIARSTDEMQSFIDQLKNLDGTAEAMRQTMEGGWGGTIDRITSAFDGLRLALGEIIANYLIKFESVITGTTRKVQEFFEANKDLVINMVKLLPLLAGIGAGLLALSGALATAGFAATALGGLAGTFGMVKGMVMGIVTALTAGSLPTALITLTGLVAAFHVKWEEVYDYLATEVAGIIKDLKADLREMGETLKLSIEAGDFDGAMDSLSVGLELAILRALENSMGGVIDVFSKLTWAINQLLDVMEDRLGWISNPTGNIFDTLGMDGWGIREAFEWWNLIPEAVEDFNKAMGTEVEEPRGNWLTERIKELEEAQREIRGRYDNIFNDMFKSYKTGVQTMMDALSAGNAKFWRDAKERADQHAAAEGKRQQQMQETAVAFWSSMTKTGSELAKWAGQTGMISTTVRGAISGTGSATSLQNAFARSQRDVMQRQLEEQVETNQILTEIYKRSGWGIFN